MGKRRICREKGCQVDFIWLSVVERTLELSQRPCACNSSEVEPSLHSEIVKNPIQKGILINSSLDSFSSSKWVLLGAEA